MCKYTCTRDIVRAENTAHLTVKRSSTCTRAWHTARSCVKRSARYHPLRRLLGREAFISRRSHSAGTRPGDPHRWGEWLGRISVRERGVGCLSYSRGPSPPRDSAPMFLESPAPAGGLFTTSAAWKAHAAEGWKVNDRNDSANLKMNTGND